MSQKTKMQNGYTIEDVDNNPANNVSITAKDGVLQQETSPGNYTRVSPKTIAMSASTDVARNIPNNAHTTVIYEDVTFDTDSGMNVTTGVYTIQEDGIYLINGTFTFSSLSSNQGELVIARVYKNGGVGVGTVVAEKYYDFDGNSTFTRTYDVFGLVQLVQGDTIEISAYHNTGATEALDVSSTQNQFSIARI